MRVTSGNGELTYPTAKRIKLRTRVSLLLTAAGLLHALYYAAGMLGGWEKDLWNLLQMMAGLGAGAVGFWIYAWRSKPFGRKAAFWIRLGQVVALLGLLSAGTLLAVILSAGREKSTEPMEYILVLGARVRGETVTLSLRERLDTAYKLWTRHPESTLILSGGQGPGEALTEAEAMKRYLLTRGVPEGRIRLEDRSTSTYENMLFTKQLVDSKEGNSMGRTFTVVTNDYHLYRSKRLAERVGLKVNGHAASTPPFTLPKAYTRELAAVLKSVIFDR